MNRAYRRSKLKEQRKKKTKNIKCLMICYRGFMALWKE